MGHWLLSKGLANFSLIYRKFLASCSLIYIEILLN